VKVSEWYKQLLGQAVAAMLLLFLAQAEPAAGGQDKTAAAPNDKAKAEYVGVDVCKTCHEDLYKTINESLAKFERERLH